VEGKEGEPHGSSNLEARISKLEGLMGAQVLVILASKAHTHTYTHTYTHTSTHFRSLSQLSQLSRTSAIAMARIIVAPQIAAVRYGLKPSRLNPVEIS
jgi:hypothetical protein